jgi:long-chain acyl-CoA synthetase
VALAGPLARRAATRPDETALRSGKRRLTRADLHEWSLLCAGRLATDGLREGDTCLLLVESPVDELAALAATDRLGVTAVVGDARWPDAARTDVVDALRPDHVLHDVPPRDHVVPYGRRRAVRARPVAGDETTPWLATCTSGSTGVPRVVLRTRASWTASHPAFSALTAAGPGRTVLVPGPLSGSLYLYGAVHALVEAGTLLLEPVGTPLRWDVAHLVPAQLATLLATDLDLAGRTAVVSGAALPDRLAAVAAARGLEVLAYYGATELSFVAMGHAGTPLRPFPWVEVLVRDGVVWVRSPYLGLRYLGAPGGAWRTDPNGWASVGDRGAVDASGGLVVMGRGDTTVTTGGATVLVEEVEAVIRRLPGVTDVVVVGTPHPALGEVVTAVVVPQPGAGVEAWRAAAAAALAPAARPRRWYLVPELPGTPAGKPARAGVRDGLVDGSLGARRLP